MFMHAWQKFAICIQTCLESSKMPQTPLGELMTLPRLLNRLGRGCPLPIPQPPRRLWHFDPQRLELGPPHFQTKVTPLNSMSTNQSQNVYEHGQTAWNRTAIPQTGKKLWIERRASNRQSIWVNTAVWTRTAHLQYRQTQLNPESLYAHIDSTGSQIIFPFGALTLLVGRQEGHPACKNWVVGCWHSYLSGARCRFAYRSADATATHYLLLQLSRPVLPEWFCFSGASLPRLFWKKGH